MLFLYHWVRNILQWDFSQNMLKNNMANLLEYLCNIKS